MQVRRNQYVVLSPEMMFSKEDVMFKIKESILTKWKNSCSVFFSTTFYFVALTLWSEHIDKIRQILIIYKVYGRFNDYYYQFLSIETWIIDSISFGSENILIKFIFLQSINYLLNSTIIIEIK